jgi:DNA-binding NarL/FixJ family response regulator
MIQKIRVLCVDDNTDVCEVLCGVIDAEPDMECAGQLHSADLLSDEVASSKPDVVLLDLTMPGREPLDALRDSAERSPQTRIMVLSGHSDPEWVNKATDRGAWGYLSKDAGMTELLSAIRRVHAGECVLPS